MSALRSHLEDYLDLRRSLGFKLGRTGQLLGLFVCWLDELGQARITTGLACAWACLPEDADPSWWAARYQATRGFARYLATIDPASQVPPAGLLTARSRRAEPYPYREDHILALMAAAGSIRSPLRAATYQTLIGLLWSTGLRVGEAIALDRDDAVPGSGVLVVRNAKFRKSREVPLHHSVSDALSSYAAIRGRLCPIPLTSAFFVSVTGKRLIYNNVHFTFHNLVGQAGLTRRSPRCRPRIHDLRHAFVLRAYAAAAAGAADPRYQAQIATIIGHVSPVSTYWYLDARPELLDQAVARLEARAGHTR
jgi:integrase